MGRQIISPGDGDATNQSIQSASSDEQLAVGGGGCMSSALLPHGASWRLIIFHTLDCPFSQIAHIAMTNRHVL